MSDGKPTLWQLDISHYSEKARWALAHKGVAYRRRAPLPGGHMAVALWLTRGSEKTLPILQLDGRTIGDSTAIVAALEARYPEPPLYPADPEQRRRALALEDFFDEELVPHTRLLAFHELINEPQMFAEVASQAVPAPLGRAKGFVGAYARAFTSLRFGANSDAAAATARGKIVAAMDRLDAELAANGGEYLVGEGFTVADLTAAALFYPLVAPAEGPLPDDTPRPPALESFRVELSDRPGFLWVEEMFRRHRHPAHAGAASASL
jgi:glutathione S-transferase